MSTSARPEPTPIPGLESPIATVSPECPSEPCEIGAPITVLPVKELDTLAYTGALDVVAPALGALVLLYAGLALIRGPRVRRFHKSQTGDNREQAV